MKIKTSELSGAALDWAVAKCEGIAVRSTNNGEDLIRNDKVNSDWWYPSENWAQGGPIIAHEGISLDFIGVGEGIRVQAWFATKWLADDLMSRGKGQTPLIAAMRCYVASKLGEEVEVPEELNIHNQEGIEP